MEMQGGDKQPMDKWLESRMHKHLFDIKMAMEKFGMRDTSGIIYFDIHSDIKWYLRRGGNNSELIGKVLNAWLRTMAPFTPHMAEELWEMTGQTELISASGYPEPNEFSQDKDAEVAEDYLRSVQQDISDILKMTGMKPSMICLYTAFGWKYDVQQKMASGKNMGDVMKESMADPELRSKSKEISAFASKLMKEMKKFGDAGMPKQNFDEYEILHASIGFFQKEFCSGEFNVYSGDEIEAGTDKKTNVPEESDRKKKMASPYKPAIYVEEFGKLPKLTLN